MERATFEDVDMAVSCCPVEQSAYRSSLSSRIQARKHFSLGTGIFPVSGPISFSISPTISALFSKSKSKEADTTSETEDEEELYERQPSSGSPYGNRSRNSSVSFIRTADLGLDLEQDPPVLLRNHDPRDAWIGIDTEMEDGTMAHSPMALAVVTALARAGLTAAMNEQMWKPEKHTEKLMLQVRNSPILDTHGTAADKDVMLWMGNFSHGCSGHDLPAVKARGIVAMSPDALVHLLLDSERVHLYNKMSLGRQDELVFSNNLHDDSPTSMGVTKVVKSRSKPPMMKLMEFVSLLHARRLREEDACGEGFVVVSRAVTRVTEHTVAITGGSEILLNVNVIRRIEGHEDKCEMINVNHIRSPGVPLMIAKKIGLSCAAGFIHDLRVLC